MNQLERQNNDSQSNQAPGQPGDPNPANLNAIRQTASAMLAAADDAINRVLSGDSQAFNAAARQQGGQ